MGEGARCPWAKTEHEILYHDTEWCRPCRDDRALFELLAQKNARITFDSDVVDLWIFLSQCHEKTAFSHADLDMKRLCCLKAILPVPFLLLWIFDAVFTI